MNASLRRAAGVVERRPGITLVVLLGLTVLFGALASQQTTDTDMTAFAPTSELTEATDRIAEEFGAAGGTDQTAIQVIVDAGAGGDVLSPQGLEVADRVADIATATPETEAILSP